MIKATLFLAAMYFILEAINYYYILLTQFPYIVFASWGGIYNYLYLDVDISESKRLEVLLGSGARSHDRVAEVLMEL